MGYPSSTGTTRGDHRSSTKNHFRRLGIVVAAALGGSLIFYATPLPVKTPAPALLGAFDSLAGAGTEACPQFNALYPSEHEPLLETLNILYDSDGGKARMVNWLSGAIQVKTESFDDMKAVGADERWKQFDAFHEYLVASYPKVHSTVSLTKVNTYGLVYHWQGSDSSLKPILLTAHQDVVPVNPETFGEWTYPPYAGYYDGEFMWGRGSLDDKTDLIGLMSTLEILIEKGFKPSRTIVLSLGFDEEIMGAHGAQYLGQYLLKTYGKNGFAMLVDEGGQWETKYGSTIAIPGTNEKGYMDVRLELSSPGGHSSVPPPHTSIGMLSSMLVAWESDPFPVHLTRTSPLYSTLQCISTHASSVDSKLRKLVKSSDAGSNKALNELEEVVLEDKAIKNLLGTTQAIDIIRGGVKTNALPERAYAVMNHRISTDSSVAETESYDFSRLLSLARQYSLAFTAFNDTVYVPATPTYGTLVLSHAFGASKAREPAPGTPTGSGDDAEPWRLLSGTIRAVYNGHRGIVSGSEEDKLVVSPGMGTGGTDTRWYWDLTPHIFRYRHFDRSNPAHKFAHTVDERILMDSFVEIMKFYATLILNADEAVNL